MFLHQVTPIRLYRLLSLQYSRLMGTFRAAPLILDQSLTGRLEPAQGLATTHTGLMPFRHGLDVQMVDRQSAKSTFSATTLLTRELPPKASRSRRALVSRIVRCHKFISQRSFGNWQGSRSKLLLTRSLSHSIWTISTWGGATTPVQPNQSVHLLNEMELGRSCSESTEMW